MLTDNQLKAIHSSMLSNAMITPESILDELSMDSESDPIEEVTILAETISELTNCGADLMRSYILELVQRFIEIEGDDFQKDILKYKFGRLFNNQVEITSPIQSGKIYFLQLGISTFAMPFGRDIKTMCELAEVKPESVRVFAFKIANRDDLFPIYNATKFIGTEEKASMFMDSIEWYDALGWILCNNDFSSVCCFLNKDGVKKYKEAKKEMDKVKALIRTAMFSTNRREEWK